jgi:hypothetical protein
MRLTRRAEYRRHLLLLALLMGVAVYLMQRSPVRDTGAEPARPAGPAIHLPQLGAGGPDLSHLTVAKSD